MFFVRGGIFAYWHALIFAQTGFTGSDFIFTPKLPHANESPARNRLNDRRYK